MSSDREFDMNRRFQVWQERAERFDLMFPHDHEHGFGRFHGPGMRHGIGGHGRGHGDGGEGGRGRESGGGGRRGRGRDPGGFDNGEFTRGRKFSSDDLQLLLLALLAERASHGYELIKELDARSAGFYSPSPGMVYPALTYLEELGYAAVETSGNKKSYSLLPAGHEYLQAHRARVDELLSILVYMARRMTFLRGAMAEESGNRHGDGWLAEFVEARHTLKRALLLKSAAGPDEQRRVAAILDRATEAINSGKPAGEAFNERA